MPVRIMLMVVMRVVRVPRSAQPPIDSFARDYGAAELLKTRQSGLDPDDERTLVDLLVERIEFADVVILDKTDVATADQLGECRAIIRSLNPVARLIETVQGTVAPDAVVGAARMPIAVASAAPPARWVIVTDSLGAALGRVRDPGVQLAWWQRPVDDLLVAGIGAVPDEAPPHLRLVVPPAGAADSLRRAAACDGGPLRPLIRDIDDLARRFAAITRAAGLLVRLEQISGDACRRWHADNVPLRLLCTYRGPITMLAPPDTVGRAVDGAVSADDSPAVQPPCLDVRILEGLRFGDNTPPMVHRSPQLAGTGKTRYLLAIDPVHDPD